MTRDDDLMDFGDDGDGDFLTGKLAALGIDEDLELSGGEEENDDPVCSPELMCVVPPKVTRRSASQTSSAAATTSMDEAEVDDIKAMGAMPRSAERAGSGEGHGGGDTETPPPPARPLEEGELSQMLDRPLQATRGSSSRTSGHRAGNKRHWSNLGGRVKGRNVTIKECANWVCQRLKEPKYYLMCQVVATIGYNKSKRLLGKVKQIQDAGGMPTADGTRKRTAGGVFFTLLKEHMEPAKLKALYADEVRVKKERERAKRAAKKRKAEAADADADDVGMRPRDSPREKGSAGTRPWRAPDDSAASKRACSPAGSESEVAGTTSIGGKVD